MARKPKLRVVGEEASAGPGHNSGLTDDQRQALTRQHMAKYQNALQAKKDADSALRNLAKTIKADLGDGGMANIKLLIQLETDDGETKFREEMERKAMVARWAGLPIGAQGNLFDEDRRPIEERAFEEGKSAGMSGKDAKPPHAPGHVAYDKWMEGWHSGQAVLSQGIKKTPEADLLRSGDAEEPKGADDFDTAAG